ncbi:MAG: hypothetical protein KDC67_06370 [Ignavibacteriae bacterium]|nr:hypothetical protein [Ignavibacteriota bacterium]
MKIQNTYKGYDDLPTHNFYEIASKGDLGWFFKDYDGDGKEIEQETKEILAKRFHSIYDERIAYTGNVNTEHYFKVANDIIKLENKLMRIENALMCFETMSIKSEFFQQYVDYFKEEGIMSGEVKTEKEKESYITTIKNKKSGFRNKLKLLKFNNKDILDAFKDKSEKEVDILRLKILLEESLDLKYRLDLKTIPIKEFDALHKRAEQKRKK